MQLPPPNIPQPTELASFLASLPSRLEIERELYTRSLYEFAKAAWHILEPGRPFKDNWHIRAICEHLQAVSEGKLHRIIINVPPRHMKSLLVSVFWPVWDWISHPHRQFLTASYRDGLSTRDALKSRQVIESPWFQRRFGHVFAMSKDQNQKTRYQNDKMGHRIAITTAGGVGEGGDFLIADDPQNTDKMGSDPYVETTTDWWNNTFLQRLNDQNDGAVVLTMQRLSEKDICELAIAEGGWTHLMLPAEFEPARRCTTPLGFQDPRTEEGELLWPNRIGREALDKMKKRLGSYGTAGQLQQRPAPKGGGILKRDTYKRIKRADLPHFFHHILSLDTAATEDENNDPTGFTLWGLSNQPGKQGMFKLASGLEWLDVPGLGRFIPDYARSSCPPGTEVLIEAAGPSGLAMLQTLKKKYPHLTLTQANPKELGGGKTERARLAAIHLENGLVWVVEEDPNGEAYLDRSDSFPKCNPRDDVDSGIQAVLYGMTTYTFESGDWSYIGSSSPSDDDEDPYSNANDNQWR